MGGGDVSGGEDDLPRVLFSGMGDGEIVPGLNCQRGLYSNGVIFWGVIVLGRGGCFSSGVILRGGG